MTRYYRTYAVKSWLTFVSKNKDGTLSTFRVIDLPTDLIDEYVQFQINYFAKNELTHQIAGIPSSSKALDEYKDILKDTCANPPYYSIICCPEINGNILPEIVATSTIKLHKKHDLFNDYQAKTSEVKKLFQIIRDWNDLYPYVDVMEKYGENNALDYQSITVRPDYYRHGFANKIGFTGYELCKVLNVGLLFAWCTTDASKKAAEKNGWRSEYKVTPEEVAKKLKVPFQSPSTEFHFMVNKLNKGD